MSTISNIEVYQENACWYVRYTQDGKVIVSNPFMEEQHAINYSLNLKSI